MTTRSGASYTKDGASKRKVISQDECLAKDRRASTKRGHKFALDCYIDYCRAPIDKGGLGERADYYEPATVPGFGLQQQELDDDKLKGFLWFFFDMYQQSKYQKISDRMRKLHGWISYCCKKYGYTMDTVSKSAQFPKTNEMWVSISNSESFKGEKRERAVPFTDSDNDKIHDMSFRLPKPGQIQWDWLNRILFHDLSKTMIQSDRHQQVGTKPFSRYLQL